MAISKTLTSAAAGPAEPNSADAAVIGIVASDTNPVGASAAKDQTPGKPGKTQPKHAAAADVSASKANKVEAATETKSEILLKKLRLAEGATLDQLVEESGWQPHSVRGFLSGTVKKKLGLKLASETGGDGMRRYRIEEGGHTS